ncbi:uncharacterized protein LOC124171539 [Ischnura elegans]|uniref:uncharacterized protein LOC124154508 n=1 Tax=Ischnura elegans TaxID=197161 RepID=UPI001ED88E5E|nr:uncharacterized protein LOC124154508 [Ischnura elegans]XP_046389450.1 uncharacterized protein LOC124158411 [Ischnura elegans]XP_046394121.1 uncharacterized protein LOC124161904 [Ischnura elegans]XP_046397592.1 uncharacterized protein LOC124164350 [Ischnura elegans]XP_046397999.1 uncharacterized protein LOC124164839 [Ischnura elegans]XP_046406643.1 uncharacterized protein LOC124171506 [Ischnura elegans]XP_046406679.1 uncharacterized protein LOC124171539 [Ischnura elegans]
MEENSAVFNVVPICWFEYEEGHEFVLWPNESTSVGEEIKRCVSPSDDWRQCPVIRKTPLIDDYNLAKEFEAVIIRVVEKGYKTKSIAIARNKRVVMKTSTKLPGESSSSDEAAEIIMSSCFNIPQRGNVAHEGKRAKTSLSENENAVAHL